jgi:hypothetical protein
MLFPNHIGALTHFHLRVSVCKVPWEELTETVGQDCGYLWQDLKLDSCE